MGVLENRMAASRAFSVQVGVLCANGIRGRWFRAFPAHRARAILSWKRTFEATIKAIISKKSAEKPCHPSAKNAAW